MIKPVNGHIVIDPIKYDAFMASYKETYQEIGTIVEAADDVVNNLYNPSKSDSLNLIGNTVYFDAWLAAKYPKEGGNPDEYYWLVKWEDVRALGQDLYAKPE